MLLHPIIQDFKMLTANQETETKKLSVAMHRSVAQAIAETAKDENISFSAQLRSLIHIGLESYGKKVRGNQIVQQ